MLTAWKSDHYQNLKISDIAGKLKSMTGEIKGEIGHLSKKLDARFDRQDARVDSWARWFVSLFVGTVSCVLSIPIKFSTDKA